MIEQNERSENHAALHANLGRLKNVPDCRRTETPNRRDSHAASSRVRRPQVTCQLREFYIANGAVLVPVFNDQTIASRSTLSPRSFPTREIVPIYAAI